MTLEEQLEQSLKDRESKNDNKEHWTKIHLGIQPEKLLGVVCLFGWMGTLGFEFFFQ